MNRKTIILTGFILIKFVLQYTLISPEYELHRDEFLHLDQANHLAWGYLSVPPVTAWIAWLVKLLGNTIFWVRFFPALFGALTIWVIWKTIEELKGDLFALLLGATGMLFSVLLRLNILFQPNSLDVLGWTLFYFVFIKYLNTQKTTWLYAGAVVFALAVLNKYNIAFLLIGLLPALILTPQRKILGRPQVYTAAGVALILILPNLWWQYTHHFPVIHHMNELKRTQLIHVSRSGFIKTQFLFFLGALPVILAGFYALLFYPPFKKYRLFFWSYVFTVALFIYFRAKDYYAIGLYPIYIAFGATYLSKILNGRWVTLLKPISVALPLLCFIPIFRVGFPNKSPLQIAKHPEAYKKLGLLRWEDGKEHALPQDFSDMLGWEELARKTDSLYMKMPVTGKTMVLCDNYGQAGAINFYTTKGIRAFSFNADYLHWFNLKQPYQHLIRIKEHETPSTELSITGPYFQQSFVGDSVTNSFAREYRTTIFVFKNAWVDINNRLKAELDTMQRRWY
ncbi:glycosyltransferase family 39 protein [Niabella sp. CC-SYL272]|uniref:glycosyltransferase family 39 protein n=1 Tax=Niabella agricola TaxID=2891571 RepID=UPI001F27C427|nr:glycosyltransferase family 39 protein [Niabella agricola]MCF3111290.1 glycosyltransferase family 39 protein [Niabella agricola]